MNKYSKHIWYPTFVFYAFYLFELDIKNSCISWYAHNDQ
jgi:hypothetical protein